ncbi:MAG: type 4a pilus biogenesis protein PilO [bacterium]|nr:MAG: type 4a pilus biogenesis protein PilO [bacterium]
MAFGIDAQKIANLSPRKKAILILAFAGLIVGLYWYSVYRGKAVTIKNLRSDLSNKQAKLNENEAIARNLPRFKSEVEKLNLQLGKVVQELPNSREIPNLLETISNLGAINGLEVLFIRPQADVDKGFYAEVPIQVRVKGGYHEMGLFLDSVSKLPRIINVSDITMGNPSEDARSGAILLDISALATTYRYIEKGG